MDTQSYLMSLGWAGPGHPLHPDAYKHKGHRGLAYNPKDAQLANGLIKPLLASKKDNTLGLGRRAHEPQKGNDWWLKGFERALGDVGKSESERSSGVSTPVNFYEGKHTGLYNYFKKGEMIEGTIGKDGKVRGRKRKSDAFSSDDEQSQSTKENAGTQFEQMAAFLVVRDKDEKRLPRSVKSTPQEDFESAKEFFGARDRDKKRRQSPEKTSNSDIEENDTTSASEVKSRREEKSFSHEEAQIVETKEQRRERRRRRKEDKAANEALLVEAEALAEDLAAKARRKEEKRRRKGQAVEV